MSDTGCGRLISVLAFYVFSCSCFHGSQPRKPSREIRNESELLWREEIESGPTPSFLKNNYRQSSRGSSHVNSKSSRASTPSSAKATSQFPLSITPGAEPQPLENLMSLAEKQKCQRITTVTVSELPKIHPPINDRHPPVVSALPGPGNAMAWMTLPPPPARVMRAINRATHIRKASQRGGAESPYLNKRLVSLGNCPIELSGSSEKPVVALVENIGKQRSVRERRHEGQNTRPEASYVSVSQYVSKERLNNIPSPGLSTHSGAEYECRYLDPNSGATKTYTLPYGEGFMGQTPPPSATTFVEVIRRPPPIFKGPLLPSQNLDGFEDIYS